MVEPSGGYRKAVAKLTEGRGADLFLEARLVVATAAGIDTSRRRVRVEGPEIGPPELAFDGLLLAEGSRLHRPTVPGLERHAGASTPSMRPSRWSVTSRRWGTPRRALAG